MDNWKQLSASVYHELDLGRAYGISDVGTVRGANQDNFFISPELGLVALADGMGGHDAGGVASAEAIGALCDFIGAAGRIERDGQEGDDADATLPGPRAGAFDPGQNDPEATWTDATMRAMITLHDALEFANERLYRSNRASGHEDGTGMGTTLTGLWQVAPDGPAFVFHVGDSRLYRYRAGGLVQLTHDQTLYQQALERGDSGPLPPRNLLLQAMGPARAITPELQSHALAPGDLYLLCSDGLYGEAAPGAIESILARTGADNLDAGCAELIEMAKRAGSRDNITAVLIQCRA